MVLQRLKAHDRLADLIPSPADHSTANVVALGEDNIKSLISVSLRSFPLSDFAYLLLI